MNWKSIVLAVTLISLLSGCDSQSLAQQNAEVKQQHDIAAQEWISHGETYNPEAPIPPQCYTKTEGVNNPCYVCHQSYVDQPDRPNMLRDGFQQGSYAFSDEGLSNSWKNLFVDRREFIDSVSDEAISEYIAQDNYSDLLAWMRSDAWSGVVPDLDGLHKGAEAFDEYGMARDGSRWVAFNYKPMPSTFWPTNGSTDDVMIRLPEAFRQRDGQYSRDVYYANLALLEMAIAATEATTVIPLDERKVGADLDGDGELRAGTTRILRRSHYVGDAGAVDLAHMLYPEGVEFLHTVRYIAVDGQGEIAVAPRMKEVRYMKKDTFFSKGQLLGNYYQERKEKHFEKLPLAVDHRDQGMSNRFGWLLWGFIEDADGRLRKQHHEEQFFCTGCHKSVGSTIDQTFAFPRKLAGAAGWGYIDLKAMQDTPSLGERQGEYLTYLQRVGGGDEYRQNDEMLERWFTADGLVDTDKVSAIPSIYELITPSPQRALALNKAYLAIVLEQSYLYGRDAVIRPAVNVFHEVDESVAPLKPEHRYQWDLRLDWQTGPSMSSLRHVDEVN